MLITTTLNVLAVLAGLTSAAPAEKKRSTQLLTDINVIQNYWGQIRPYNNSPAAYFGVKNTGLPDGCGYEQGA